MRHARILEELGFLTAVSSSRKINFPIAFRDIQMGLLEHKPDYVVVANATNNHYETLLILADAGFSGQVLVEKPILANSSALPEFKFKNLSVAYNLRFHPVIQRLKEVIRYEKTLSAQIYVGQYLPNWRPEANYQHSYSSSSVRGGGVLRDLSHELDYTTLLFGDWKSVTALGGHVSNLEIDSDDIFVVLLQTERCPVVSIQTSYLDRVVRRLIVINTQHHTIEANLVAGTLSIDGCLETFSLDQDHTYREMHSAIMNGNIHLLCPAKDALAVLHLIEAAELANKDKKWIMR